MTNTSASGGYLSPSSALPPEDDAFDNVLQALVVGITALPGNLVRPRWQPTPPPQPESTVNWCAVGVTEENPEEGRGFITHDGADNGGLGSDTLQVNDQAVILASFYGPNARSFANLLRDGLMVPQNREAIELQNYRLVEIPRPARFVPEIINQQTVRRVDVEFRLVRSNVYVYPIENIVEVIGTLHTETVAIPFTQDDTPP